MANAGPSFQPVIGSLFKALARHTCSVFLGLSKTRLYRVVIPCFSGAVILNFSEAVSTLLFGAVTRLISPRQALLFGPAPGTPKRSWGGCSVRIS